MTIVQTLRNYLNKKENMDFKADFQQAFKLALTYNIKQFDDFGIKTFEDYLNFYETFLRWVPTETIDGKNVYYHLCIFHFVLDLPPMKEHQSKITPHSHWTWLSQWIIDFCKEIGRFHDSEASLTKESLETFRKCPLYNVDESWPQDWKTFNQFFARTLKDGARPIDPDTSTEVVITHPADSVFNGSWDVDDCNHVVFVKHVPWNISQLLDGTLYGDQFAGGRFIHSFLNANDYHRQHAPVSGKVIEACVIPGLCYLEVNVSEPQTGGGTTLSMKRKLAYNPEHATCSAPNDSDRDTVDAPDSPGYQFIQARGLIIIDNPDIGLVAVLPIGMAQVSSVVLSVKPGQEVKKGQEISYFQMGGSDCIVVFQARVNITANICQKYLYGKEIARAPKNRGPAKVATARPHR